MQIAFIDFDGTLTRKDSFFQFIKRVAPGWKHLVGLGFIGCWYLAFLSGFISRQRLKEKAIQFFLGGKDANSVYEKSNRFARNILPGLITERGKMLLYSYKKKDVKIVIVTASLDLWIKPWCRQMGYDYLCSHIEIVNGKITGKIIGENCRGVEKVNQIKKHYILKGYNKIFVHGDSKQDMEMLRLGTDSFYKWEKMRSIKD